MVFGSSGTELTDTEAQFFRDAQPLGFILFARNCESPDQVRALVDAMRAAVGRADAPVLIDQEGGRVARLGPPHWWKPSSASSFAALAARDLEAGAAAVRLNARLIAADLSALGITVDCAPVLDLRQAGSHAVIGDRAFGDTADAVTALGRAFCEGCLAGGVLPVIKHIPGHGRATVDSHEQLPVVDVSLQALRETDFAPFQALRDMPWAMTGHVVYTAIDPDQPATTSATLIADVIRGDMGFDGVLVSDDLSMQALSGNLGERAGAALAAGCDVVLHCNGDMDEMEAVAAATGDLSKEAQARLRRGAAMASAHYHDTDAFDSEAGLARLDTMLGEGAVG